MDVGRVGRVGVGGAEAYPRVDDTDLAFGSRDARGFERGDEALQRLFFALLLVRLQPREERSAHGGVERQFLLGAFPAASALKRGDGLEQGGVLGGGVSLLRPRRRDVDHVVEREERHGRGVASAARQRAEDGGEREGERATLRAVGRGLDHLVEDESERGGGGFARGFPDASGSVPPPLPPRGGGDEGEALVPVFGLRELVHQRPVGGGDVAGGDERREGHVGAAVEEEPGVSGLDVGAGEELLDVSHRRGGDRVGENQVGEELALRAGTRGARGKRVDRVQEAIRDVAPRDAVAVRERREPSPETRQFARHLLREQSTNARRHLLGYRRARHELGRSHVILEVRVLVHEARQRVRHVPQRGGGRHAEATMPPTKIRRRLF